VAGVAVLRRLRRLAMIRLF